MRRRDFLILGLGPMLAGCEPSMKAPPRPGDEIVATQRSHITVWTEKAKLMEYHRLVLAKASPKEIHQAGNDDTSHPLFQDARLRVLEVNDAEHYILARIVSVVQDPKYDDSQKKLEGQRVHLSHGVGLSKIPNWMGDEADAREAEKKRQLDEDMKLINSER